MKLNLFFTILIFTGLLSIVKAQNEVPDLVTDRPD